MCPSERLRLLGMVSYLVAGTNNSKFLKAFNVQDAEGSLSYDWDGELSKMNTDSAASEGVLQHPETNKYHTGGACCQQMREQVP